jgi:hypothetical protein
MEPQHDSVTNCAVLVSLLMLVPHENEISYVLHGACERIVAFLEGGVDVVLARHLVAHFDALVEEDFVGFFDLFFGVVGDHICDFIILELLVGYRLSQWFLMS